MSRYTAPDASGSQDQCSSPHARTAAVHDLTESIIHADCLNVLSGLDDASVDLVYLDPPFNTGRVHSASASRFNDQWDSIDAYLAFLRPRVEQMHRALRPTGSILLHCDWRTCHLLRVMLDAVFGVEHFVNHLIWTYGLGGSSPRRFARKHDDILFYGRTSDYYFQPPMIPAASVRMRGQLKKATDVIDIPAINNMAIERTGYPTQKPLALLKMLIGACCERGGLVVDPFCGSGTTLAAAWQLDRRFLGVDINHDAIAIARRRCAEQTVDDSSDPLTPTSRT